MTTSVTPRSSGPLAALLEVGSARELTDGQLLQRFAAGRAVEADLAFEVLVDRHGPMVLRVAQAILGNAHDADDAFQATFLVLASRARKLAGAGSVGPWVHEVARRTASCLKRSIDRRRALDRRSAPAERVELPREDLGELARAVHEEIGRLPDRFRAAVVLCDLEGQTHEQAAGALGWPVGTVKSRQARARGRLRASLRRRGFDLAAILPALGRPGLGPVPGGIARVTARVAARSLSSRAIAPGSAGSLARKVLMGLAWGRRAKVAATIAGLGVMTGVGMVPQGRPGDREEPPASVQAPSPGPNVVEVRPARFDHRIAEGGVVELAQSSDVASDVEGKNTILAIKPEGTQVKKGEVVAELDPSSLEDRLGRQQVDVASAEAAYLDARRTRERGEQLEREHAEVVVPRELLDLEAEVRRAEASLAEAQRRLERSRGSRDNVRSMNANRRVGWNSTDLANELEIEDRVGVAELDVQVRSIDLERCKDRLETRKARKSDREAWRLERDVADGRARELKLDAAWQLRKAAVARTERLIRACEVVAPADGIVAYPPPSRPGAAPIEPGGSVAERQKIFSVVDPDGPKRLLVNVAEPLVDQVMPGQSVRIEPRAMPGRVLTGTVRSVAPAADPVAFARDGRKAYPTSISLDEPVPGLRPGMKAAAEILLFSVDDALAVPVASLVKVDDRDRVAVEAIGGSIDLREVTLGRSNGSSVEVKKGLRPGDRVIVPEVRQAPAARAPGSPRS